MNNRLGYAEYEDMPECSGGGKVAFLGNHPDNWLEWRDVYSREGGLYDMNIRYLAGKEGFVMMSVNGKKSIRIELPQKQLSIIGHEANEPANVTVRIALRKGKNIIRLSNPEDWAPDIDCMTLIKADGGQK